jgi:hypothetical protein
LEIVNVGIERISYKNIRFFSLLRESEEVVIRLGNPTKAKEANSSIE